MTEADVGRYARAFNAFLADGAETPIDLIGAYGSPTYVFNG